MQLSKLTIIISRVFYCKLRVSNLKLQWWWNGEVCVIRYQHKMTGTQNLSISCWSRMNQKCAEWNGFYLFSPSRYFWKHARLAVPIRFSPFMMKKGRPSCLSLRQTKVKSFCPFEALRALKVLHFLTISFFQKFLHFQVGDIELQKLKYQTSFF